MSERWYPRLSPSKYPPWLQRLHGTLQDKIIDDVDADNESGAAIFRKWNLIRFIGARSFRTFVASRRAALQRYRSRRWQEQQAREAEQRAAQQGGRT